MTLQERADIVAALSQTAELFAATLTPGMIDSYIEALDGLLPVAQVLDALRDARRTLRFFPKPVEIRELVQAHDGHLAPEAAWALVAHLDEESSVVWTDEIARAFGVARPLMDNRIQARQAFLEDYRERLRDARDANRGPHWWLSEGWDKAGRLLAVAAAIRQGRMPAQSARPLPGPDDWLPAIGSPKPKRL